MYCVCFPSGVYQKSKKQLFKSLNPVPSPEPVTPSVHATYAAKSEYANGDIGKYQQNSVNRLYKFTRRTVQLQSYSVWLLRFQSSNKIFNATFSWHNIIVVMYCVCSKIRMICFRYSSVSSKETSANISPRGYRGII